MQKDLRYHQVYQPHTKFKFKVVKIREMQNLMENIYIYINAYNITKIILGYTHISRLERHKILLNIHGFQKHLKPSHDSEDGYSQDWPLMGLQ